MAVLCLGHGEHAQQEQGVERVGGFGGWDVLGDGFEVAVAECGVVGRLGAIVAGLAAENGDGAGGAGDGGGGDGGEIGQVTAAGFAEGVVEPVVGC
jgi:hypothetical protein